MTGAARTDGIVRALSAWSLRPGLRQRPAAYAREAWIRARLNALSTRQPAPGDLLLAGFADSPSGLGQAFRAEADALGALVAHRVDVGAIAGRKVPCLPGSGDAGLAIIHANPPDFRAALALLGAERLRRRKIVAVWVWETDRVPAFWAKAISFVDEVWAPSQFAAGAIATVFPGPIRVVPHPMPFPAPRPEAVNGWRVRFAAAPDQVVCLYAFSAASNWARKNPLAAVRWFQAAAAGVPQARLILKAGDLAMVPREAEALHQLVRGDDRIALIEERLDDTAMQALIASADIVLSPHRSEGFGIFPFQAMQAGKPILATDWSATSEFLTPDCAVLVPARQIPIVDDQGVYSPSDHWAEPDENQAIAALQELLRNPSQRAALGATARTRAAARLAQARKTLVALAHASLGAVVAPPP